MTLEVKQILRSTLRSHYDDNSKEIGTKKLPDQLQITRPPDDSFERKQLIYLERRFWKLTDFLVLSTSGSLSNSKTLWQRLPPCPQR